MYSAILLAAGTSSRMGCLKALLPWKGLTLVEYVLQQLQEAGLEQIIVVIGHRRERIEATLRPCPVGMVFNPRHAEGKCSSILAGLSRVHPDCRGLLIAAVDQPVPAGVIRSLMQRHDSFPSPVTVPVYRERRGHPVLFDSALIPELLRITERTRGLRRVMEKHAANVAEVSVEDPCVLLNLNTRKAYEEAFRNYGM